ncbi:MAG: hypothetical protein Q7J15_07395 [Candidatus Desulfaltia sp.]|nr:hypothetical protein [Candidatus Desulfaltia sp.]
MGDITFIDDHVYRNNKQTAFVRITNTRDVGEERVTVTYRLSGTAIKTETFILPSGPTGSNKSYLRAFEYTPTTPSATLSVEVTAPGLPRAYTAETRRTLTSSKTRAITVEHTLTAIDIPILNAEKRTSQNFSVAYHHTTAAQNNNYTNSIMPVVNYNTYTWIVTTRNYSESLNTAVTIDSWQATEGKGRGAWEIIPKFGKDAARTVRAGSGFELRVITRYATDFDSNPPNLRTAASVDSPSYTNLPAGLGLNPQSVTKTWAAFPYANFRKSVDPNDNVHYETGSVGFRHAKTVVMENTQGTKGAHTIRWELPNFVSVGVLGTVYSARIHVIDKFYPDSYILNGTRHGHENLYRFYVVSEVAGISNLLNVHSDYINVFGVVFDDIWQTRPNNPYPRKGIVDK